MGKVSLDLFSVGIRKLISELNKLLGQVRGDRLHFAIHFFFRCIYVCTKMY